MEILETINKWDLQENLFLKFGKSLTADYSHGYTERRITEHVTERIPNYWVTSEGQYISNNQKEQLEPDSNGLPLESYKFIICDLSDGQV